MAVGYIFPILNSNGSPSSTNVDMESMFVRKDSIYGSNLWVWGQNSFGQLGLGTIVHRSSPVQLGALSTWRQLWGRCGSYTIVGKTDGQLWVWGSNSVGQIVTSVTTAFSVPFQGSVLSPWKQIGGGANHNTAVHLDGRLFTWGLNTSGQLGDGTIATKSIPTQIGALTDWSQVSGGSVHSAAVKTDGTLWVWGSLNPWGLGLSDIVNRSSPVQVGSMTNWKQVSCGSATTIALKVDGTLWAWGNNANGGLGLGDIVHRSSPVQVGSLTTWKIVAGSSHTIALKVDGTLWAWGTNSNGQLGLGDVTNRSSPVQIGLLNNWKQCYPNGTVHTIALKVDGTLWAWGNNANGQLGLNDVVHRSSPVQVGSLTNWKSVTAGDNHTIAIQDLSL